jgi:hypothetical protein
MSLITYLETPLARSMTGSGRYNLLESSRGLATASFFKDNSFSISVLFSVAAKIFCSWRHVSPNFSSAC